MILCAVRWYLRYSLSFRDVEELLSERGLKADPTTIWRGVQCYGPELEARLRRHLKPTHRSWSVDIPYGPFTVSPELMFAARQDRVFRDETETAGYAVLNLDASYIWPRQHMAHVLSFTGYNLTNVLYRNPMSFIKDLAPEVGRGVKVGYSLRFF